MRRAGAMIVASGNAAGKRMAVCSETADAIGGCAVGGGTVGRGGTVGGGGAFVWRCSGDAGGRLLNANASSLYRVTA